MDWEAGVTSVAPCTIFPIGVMNRPSGWLVSHVTSDSYPKLSGRMMEAFKRPVLPFW